MTKSYGQEYDAAERKDKSKKQSAPTLGNIEYAVDAVEKVLDRAEKSCVDPRWAAIARTDFQKAFMSLRAAILAKGRKL